MAAHPRQEAKCFVGGLSWSTTAEKLEAYFSNFGQVLEAFVSYDRHTGRPRGFGFVVFEDPQVADKVASLSHTIDRREVEAKKAVPKEEHPGPRSQQGAGLPPGRTRKVFVGGLAPSVDEAALRQYFGQFGAVEDAVVMYDHDNRRPRGFGFVTFTGEESVDAVLLAGPLQALHDKQIEIKRAVPRDQMPAPRGLPMGARGAPPPYLTAPYARSANPYGPYATPYPQGAAYGLQTQGFGQTSYGGAAYRSGLPAPGLAAGMAVPGLPGALPGGQLGLGGGLGLNTAGFPAPYGGLTQAQGMQSDSMGGMAGLQGGFGQHNPYANMSMGMSAGLGGNHSLGGGGSSAGLGVGAGSFNMGSLQNALPAVQTGVSGSDSLPGTATAAAERAGSQFTTPHAHAPQSPAAPSQGGFMASSPSAFDAALGSPMGSGLAIPPLTPHGSVGGGGSLGRDTPGLGGLQSSFTETPLGSANWG